MLACLLSVAIDLCVYFCETGHEIKGISLQSSAVNGTRNNTANPNDDHKHPNNDDDAKVKGVVMAEKESSESSRRQ